MRTAVRRAGLRAALRALATVLALSAGLAATATDADAQTRICRQLERQLAAVSSGGGSESQARKYDRAIQQQRAQLARGELQYRRAGCGGGLFWRENGGTACESIGRNLDRMERNLASLERTRGRMGGGGDGRRERARILAAIDANGCRDAPRERETPRVASREGNGSLFDRLFGGGIRSAERQPERRRERPADRGFEEFDGSARVRTLPGGNGSIQTIEPGYGVGGNYRTLCVRTCDGYYWPISYSSSRSDFARDEQNCQTMCPGTEVKLYSHKVPDEESDNMVDLSGAPYTDLTTAFKYRDASFAKPQGCTCASTRKNYSIVNGQMPQETGPMSLPVDPPAPTETVAVPVPRPDAGADPETLANRSGDFGPEAIRRLSEAPGTDVSHTISAGRKVRVVGPAYLPDQSEAATQPVPGQTAVQ